MSRARRIETVVRIRHLQARIAETDAAHARLEADRCQVAVDAAVADLAARSSAAVGRFDDVDGLRRQREILASAADGIGLRQERRDFADREFDDARADWFVAHQRHEAIERLHERTATAEAAERGRLEQVDLDEHASMRHGRERSHHHQEEQ